MGLEMSFQTKDHVCFAMDLMSRDLLCFIKNDSEYCLEHARRWIAQVALGINALHMIGIIHRDIKSENILIDIQENVRIADFGLSYVDKEPMPLSTWGGCLSEVKGTIYFMAPEILRNVEKGSFAWYGAPVDWWSFGCVLYELVSPPEHKLFDSADDIMDYVSWHRDLGGGGLFPPFQRLDPIAADLVAGLLNPLTILRYGFYQVTNHQYFLNDDGTSEFDDACSRGMFD
ncbi:kinase-like domain-containing protein [Suillus occidentalis]|nr:kinase-like domain-containing protein [Suillus occidentalis]